VIPFAGEKIFLSLNENGANCFPVSYPEKEILKVFLCRCNQGRIYYEKHYDNFF